MLRCSWNGSVINLHRLFDRVLLLLLSWIRNQILITFPNMYSRRGREDECFSPTEYFSPSFSPAATTVKIGSKQQPNIWRRRSSEFLNWCITRAPQPKKRKNKIFFFDAPEARKRSRYKFGWGKKKLWAYSVYTEAVVFSDISVRHRRRRRHPHQSVKKKRGKEEGWNQYKFLRRRRSHCHILKWKRRLFPFPFYTVRNSSVIKRRRELLLLLLLGSSRALGSFFYLSRKISSHRQRGFCHILFSFSFFLLPCMAKCERWRFGFFSLSSPPFIFSFGSLKHKSGEIEAWEKTFFEPGSSLVINVRKCDSLQHTRRWWEKLLSAHPLF